MTGHQVTRVRRGRRRWSIAIVLVVVVVAALGYQRLSAGPGTETVGNCAVVTHPSVGDRSQCADAHLSDLDLRERDLRLADLRGADLSGTDLTGAIMYGADLTGADLRGTDLSEVDLTAANLTGAKLDGARFTGAVLSGMTVGGTGLAARSQSLWTDGESKGPVLLHWSSGEQPGIVSNSCDDREGLFYPGNTSVTCRITSGPDADQATEYQIQMEVKQPPVITAPDEVSVTVGESVSVQVHADSPYPQVEAHFGRLPAGLRWDAAAQRLVGTPAPSAVGSHVAVLTAENGETVTKSIAIQVLPAR